jgi:hypothetical protein
MIKNIATAPATIQVMGERSMPSMLNESPAGLGAGKGCGWAAPGIAVILFGTSITGFSEGIKFPWPVKSFTSLGLFAFHYKDD